MSPVSFTGLATGLDTSSIVAQLVELKRQPIYRLESRRGDFQAQLSALDSLKTKLLALQKAAAGLDSSREFTALGTSSSHDHILTATATAGAAPGSYDITVESLATERKERSQGYTGSDVLIGEGRIWVHVGGTSTPLSIPPGTTLAGLRDIINNEADGVSASLINDGSQGTPYYLVLRGDTAGSAGDFTLDSSGLTGGAGPVFTTTQTAADARLTVDGIPVTADSNRPDGVISGVTLDLLAAEPGTTVRLTVEMDSEQVEASVKALVDAYNDLFSFIQDQSQPEGDLHGHPALRSVGSRLENVIHAALPGNLDGISMLWEVGISTGEDRQLVWNAEKFQAALNADFSGVRDLFVDGEGNPGKAYLITAAIDDMTDSISGLFKISTEALNNKIRTADKTIERYERGVESYRLNLEARFTAMERMVAQLQAQGNYLGSLGL